MLNRAMNRTFSTVARSAPKLSQKPVQSSPIARSALTGSPMYETGQFAKNVADAKAIADRVVEKNDEIRSSFANSAVILGGGVLGLLVMPIVLINQSDAQQDPKLFKLDDETRRQQQLFGYQKTGFLGAEHSLMTARGTSYHPYIDTPMNNADIAGKRGSMNVSISKANLESGLVRQGSVVMNKKTGLERKGSISVKSDQPI